MALRDDLIDLIAAEALVDKQRLTPSATLADVGIDSVGVVSVAFAVEEKYGVEISDEAFAGASNFGEFLNVLAGAIEERGQAGA